MSLINVKNPSDTPSCKHHEVCDKTRVCENYRRKGIGCSGSDNGPTYAWDQAEGPWRQIPLENEGTLSIGPSIQIQKTPSRAEYVPTPKQDPSTVNYHAMMGEKVVYHFAKDVDLVAFIERVYHPELVNLFVLSDGFYDIGAGAGNACSITDVMLSPGIGGWSWPPPDEQT